MSDFEDKLKSIAQSPEIFTLPAAKAIDRLLTFDNRAELTPRLNSFTFLEKELYHLLETSTENTLQAALQEKKEEEVGLEVKYNAFGRLNIRSVEEQMPSYGEGLDGFTIGYITLPSKSYEKAATRAKAGQDKEQPYQEKIDAILSHLEQEGEIKRIMKALRGNINHLETILFYINDRWYRHMEGSSNLVYPKDNALFDKLENMPVNQWPEEDRLAIIALHAMFLSGKHRCEEMNGIQLRPSWLYERLEEVGTEYSTLFGYSPDIPSDLLKRAAWVGKLADDFAGRGLLRYRLIEGTTFQKLEKITSIYPQETVDKMVPDFIKGLYQNWLSTTSVPEDHQTLFSNLADYAIKQDVKNENSACLEELIKTIVKSATIQTNSDVTMSSSFRDPGALFLDDRESLKNLVVSTGNRDFYCCVRCTEDFANNLDPKQVTKVSTMLQMRLNRIRWGYLPANFPAIEIPESRYYLYPAIMPDITFLGDQHHKSHIVAQIRYNMRAQGPDNSEQPLMINNIPYRGFYDVRMYRVGEQPNPYTLDDLKVARTHNSWVGIMWRRIIAWCTVDPDIRAKLKITGFQKGEYSIIQ
jgi:hypothetical protein